MITGLVLISTSLSGHNTLFDLPITATQIALALVVLIRFGFLAFGIIYFVFPLTSLAPITLTTSHWYAGRSIFVVLLVVGLALSGFRLALAGRPALGSLALDD